MEVSYSSDAVKASNNSLKKPSKLSGFLRRFLKVLFCELVLCYFFVSHCPQIAADYVSLNFMGMLQLIERLGGLKTTLGLTLGIVLQNHLTSAFSKIFTEKLGFLNKFLLSNLILGQFLYKSHPETTMYSSFMAFSSARTMASFRIFLAASLTFFIFPMVLYLAPRVFVEKFFPEKKEPTSKDPVDSYMEEESNIVIFLYNRVNDLNTVCQDKWPSVFGEPKKNPSLAKA